MSGHSKWSSIKHQKGVADARRGKLFTKLTNEIIVTARQGGSNPEMNARLRLAIQKARDNSMPTVNIERAIKRATGATEAERLTELTLEGYGHGGIAILVHAVSDNRNRTVQEVRHTFSRSGGNLGESGCVSWIFEPKGLIIINSGGQDADELALKVIDAGAEDVKVEDDYIEIYTKVEELEKVRAALEEDNVSINSAEVSMVPKTTVELDEHTALQVLRLLDKLEEQDDVQHVSSNADFPASALERYKAQAQV